MFIVRVEDAMFTGPRINFFLAENANTPEEALAEARAEMVDWAQEKLDEGRMEVTIYEVGQFYELKNGQLTSDRAEYIQRLKGRLAVLKLGSIP